MSPSQERLLRIVDELEESYLEQMALKTVLIAFEHQELPSWLEVQRYVAESKRSLQDKGPGWRESFNVIRQQILTEPTLDEALKILLAGLSESKLPN